MSDSSNSQIPFLNYAYRRYSSEMFAINLATLLDEHQVPFEIIAEPAGAGSVLMGATAIPGVIVMINEADVSKVKALEQELAPEVQKAKNPAEDVEQPVSLQWIILGYVFALAGAPLAILAGIHLFSAKRRASDFSFHYAYDSSARTHGKLIFWFSLSIFVFSMFRLISGARMTFLDTLSFILWQLNRIL